MKGKFSKTSVVNLALLQMKYIEMKNKTIETE